jgi:hypothetical protein
MELVSALTMNSRRPAGPGGISHLSVPLVEPGASGSNWAATSAAPAGFASPTAVKPN